MANVRLESWKAIAGYLGKDVLVMAQYADRTGNPSQAIALLEEARALQRYSCRDGEPLGPLLWLRTQARLASVLRRTGRKDLSEPLQAELANLMAGADVRVRRYVGFESDQRALRTHH
jgi:hypothetical protein